MECWLRDDMVNPTEACIVLRVRREALWRNVFITWGSTGTP